MKPTRSLFYFFIFHLLICFAIDAKEKNKTTEYKYQLSACAVFQNEGEWLKEWIEYHKLVGVEHFYLYDNGSTDHFKDVLLPYIQAGEVDLFHYPTVFNTQVEYNRLQSWLISQAVNVSKGVSKWLAVIDLDEFIVPLKNNTLPEALVPFEKYGGVYINWLAFGTSNIQKIPPGVLMIEALNYCSPEASHFGKCIVRPERVHDCLNPHMLIYNKPYYHVTTNKKKFDTYAKPNDVPVIMDSLIIHHYYTRDLDHLINVKVPRRRKWVAIDDTEQYVRSTDCMNVSLNLTMHRFIPILKLKVF